MAFAKIDQTSVLGEMYRNPNINLFIRSGLQSSLFSESRLAHYK